MCWRGQRKRLRRLAGVLADVDARNSFTKSIMWRSTDFFLRQVVNEKEGMGAVTFTCVCEHCKLFPVEDFLWRVSANHGETKKKNEKQQERKPNRLLTLQIGDTATDHTVFTACGAPGECNNMFVVLKLITNLVKGTSFCVRVKSLTESKSRLAEALATFISFDNARVLVTMVHEMVFPKLHKEYTEEERRSSL